MTTTPPLPTAPATTDPASKESASTESAPRALADSVTRNDSVWSSSFRATTIGAVALVSVFAFEAMAVTTAMPAVAAALDGLALYGLAFGATVAASVVGMVAAGIACDRRGPREPFAIGALLFMAGLAIAGLASTMAAVVIGRGVQGLGAGMAIVTLYVLVDTYPTRLQPKVFAAFAAAWVVPAFVGPAIAGILVEQWHWRAVFLLVLAIVVPGVVLVGRRMQALPPRRRESWTRNDRLRLVAATIAALGAGALHLAGQVEATGAALLLLALGVAGIATTLPRLLPDGSAMLRAGLPAVVGLRGVAASAFFGAEVLIPLLLTTQRGMHAAAAGAVLTGGAVGWSTGAWAQGRFQRPPALWVRDGFIATATGIALVALVLRPEVPVLVAAGGWVLGGLGMGMIIPTLSVQVLRFSTADDKGTNVSALQVADALTSGASLAFGGTLIAVGGASIGVFSAGLGLSIVLLILGAATAGRIAVDHADTTT